MFVIMSAAAGDDSPILAVAYQCKTCDVVHITAPQEGMDMIKRIDHGECPGSDNLGRIMPDVSMGTDPKSIKLPFS